MADVNVPDNPIMEQLVYSIRDPTTKPKEMRESLKMIGMFLGYGIARELDQEETTINTLMNADATHKVLKEAPVLVTILRASMPLYQGLHDVYQNAHVGFLGAQRNEETLEAEISYIRIPECIHGSQVIISDPMIATGNDMVAAMKIIEQYEPRKIIIAGAIAAEAGIDQLIKHNDNISIYAAAIDPDLNGKGYIVPGLGDAGDRCFGPAM